MATTRTTVKVKNDFREVGRQYDRAVQQAVAEAARIGAAVASGEAQKRRRTGAMADIKIAAVREGKRGPNALIASTTPYAVFQEFGTLGRRRKKLKQPSRRTQTSGGGIKPLRFMGKGRTAARKTLLALIVEHMSRVR